MDTTNLDVERCPNGQFGRLAHRLTTNAAFQREQQRDAARKRHQERVAAEYGAEAEALGVPASLAWTIFA